MTAARIRRFVSRECSPLTPRKYFTAAPDPGYPRTLAGFYHDHALGTLHAGGVHINCPFADRCMAKWTTPGLAGNSVWATVAGR